MLFLLKSLGWILAHIPLCFSQILCYVLGSMAYYFTSRGYLVRSNLHHAFLDKPKEWYSRIARKSLRRNIELFLFSTVLNHLPEKKLKKMIQFDPVSQEVLKKASSDSPTVVLCPHLTLMETLTLCKFLCPGLPRSGSFYRPLNQPEIDDYVRKGRERFGIELLSRRKDLFKAKEILSENGNVAILFDQNPGKKGTLSFFFDRLATTTPLPSILAQKAKAKVIILYTKRTSFWHAKLEAFNLNCELTPKSIIETSNRWLESYLSENDDQCADWLWSHARWKSLEHPKYRFRLETKKSILTQEEIAQAPKRFRLWIQLPETKESFLTAAPLLDAISKSRPDAQIHLFIHKESKALTDTLMPAYRVRVIPEGMKAMGFFWQCRHEYPDVFVNLCDSLKSDVNAYLTRCPQRFGILSAKNKKRRFLTHTWTPREVDSGIKEKWLLFFEHFGLQPHKEKN